MLLNSESQVHALVFSFIAGLKDVNEIEVADEDRRYLAN
jgi:hypothetical protein